MTARLLSFALIITGIAVFGGCSTGPVIDPVISNDIAVRGVPQNVQTKMNNGWALDYDDILTLVEHNVPEHIIVSYLQSTEKPYNFSQTQLAALRGAGAGSELTHYLQETDGFYAQRPASKPQSGVQQDENLNTQPYQDEQPFAYNAPWVDTFWNSGYEESLYSPFSMD